MTSLLRVGWIPLLLACGCTSAAPPAPASVDVRSAPSSSTAATAAAPEAAASTSEWQGSWVSQPCGDRKYPRQLNLDADGTFIMTDLISPCPPGAKCIWSGVVARKGTWSVTGSRADLVYDPAGSAASNGKGTPAPAVLQWDADKKAPAESTECVYARR